MEPKVRIGSKHKENLERVKELAKLAVGSSKLEDFVHIYSDSEKRIKVEPLRNSARVSVFYNSGVLKEKIYFVPYSKLRF